MDLKEYILAHPPDRNKFFRPCAYDVTPDPDKPDLKLRHAYWSNELSYSFNVSRHVVVHVGMKTGVVTGVTVWPGAEDDAH